MRVLQLGGAGFVGRSVARYLCRGGAVDELVIAGRGLGRARAFAATLAPAATAVRVDVADRAALAAAMRGFDLVVNTTGGDDAAIAGTLEAAIAAGVDYCDTTGGRATGRLLALDGAARAAGVTALVGIGAAPGTTNLLALAAAARLDTVERVECCFVLGVAHWVEELIAAGKPAAGAMAASVASVIEGAAGPIPLFRGGRLVEVAGPGEGVVLPVPGRAGAAVTVYPFANGEVFSLPPHLPAGAEVACLAAVAPAAVNALLRAEARRFAAGEVSAAAAGAALLEAIAADPGRWLADAVPKIPPFVAVSGRQGGRRVRCLATLAAAYGDDPEPAGAYTAAPLAVAAEMMLRGEIAGPGVLSPEACLAPAPFFAALARHWSPPAPGGNPVIEQLDRLG